MFLLFKLLALFAVILAIIMLLLIASITRNKVIMRFLVVLITLMALASCFLAFLGWWNRKTILSGRDYVGHYIIDRSYFPGKNADWQYEHFRFEITKDDSIFFYKTEGDRVINTFKGTTSYPKPYGSARLRLSMKQPTHDIVLTNPTIYRDNWDFYMVFYSSDYGNMFFTKGKWKPLEK